MSESPATPQFYGSYARIEKVLSLSWQPSESDLSSDWEEVLDSDGEGLFKAARTQWDKNYDVRDLAQVLFNRKKLGVFVLAARNDLGWWISYKTKWFYADSLDEAVKAAFEWGTAAKGESMNVASKDESATKITDKEIKHLVNRFLCYPFPSDLNPDGGISYKRSETSIKFNHPGPVGTNLLTADQAEAMVRYMVDGIQQASE